MSAGRLYDKLGKEAKGKIVFVFPGTAICRITDTGLNPQKDADEKNESN